ncbi:MAG: hypothetical protein ACKODM_14900 [Cytophagales bacterium]
MFAFEVGIESKSVVEVTIEKVSENTVCKLLRLKLLSALRTPWSSQEIKKASDIITDKNTKLLTLFATNIPTENLLTFL